MNSLLKTKITVKVPSTVLQDFHKIREDAGLTIEQAVSYAMKEFATAANDNGNDHASHPEMVIAYGVVALAGFGIGCAFTWAVMAVLA